MADHFDDDDPAAQPRREIKDEIYQEATEQPAMSDDHRHPALRGSDWRRAVAANFTEAGFCPPAVDAAVRAEIDYATAYLQQESASDHQPGDDQQRPAEIKAKIYDEVAAARALKREGLASEIAVHQHAASILPQSDEGFLEFVQAEVKIDKMTQLGETVSSHAEIDADEEERRRAGRGGGGMNPADANHSFNIRPDVVSGPAGMEVRTTMKSEDYRANPGLEADLAEAERSANQPTLTLNDIANDPWNAVELPLPDNPSEALLKAARSAAEYCAEGEHELMFAAHEGRYTPPGWTVAEGDVHEYNEGRWFQADRRLGAINEQIDRLEGRGVYAEGARPPDAPPLTNAEHDLYLETLKRYAPHDSVYNVLTEQHDDTRTNHAFPPVVDALKALLPDADGVPYPWPQTFGEVLQHIDDGVTAPQALQQVVRAGFEADDAERRAAYDAVTEPTRDDIADRLARSDRGPGDEALTPDQMRQRDNEEIVKQQEAERPARSPEDVPSDSPWSSPPSLAADLRAAERAAKIEREAEGQESVTHEHSEGEGKTPGGGGGRGMF